MTQDISSLMDGELESNEAGRVVQACCASGDQKETWYVYHVIGDAMRGHEPMRAGFPQRTIEALQGQPTVLAPRRRLLEASFTRVAFAAAASVATVGVVGWLGMQGGQFTTQQASVAKANPPLPVTNVAANVPVNGTLPVANTQPVLNVQDYLTVHRQIPSPEFYRQVSNQAPAAAR